MSLNKEEHRLALTVSEQTNTIKLLRFLNEVRLFI